MPCKEAFQDSLKELMTVDLIAVKELASSTGIHHSLLYRYLNGESVPTLENATKLAAYFSCSLDYLFGLADARTAEQYQSVATPNERFREFLQATGYTRYHVHKATGIQEKRLADWFHNRRTPSLANLYLIATAFSCSLDWLAGQEKL